MEGKIFKVKIFEVIYKSMKYVKFLPRNIQAVATVYFGFLEPHQVARLIVSILQSTLFH